MVSFQPLLTRLYQCIEVSDHVLEPLRDLHLRYKHRESCLYVRTRSVMVYKTVSVHQPASKDLWQVLLMQEDVGNSGCCPQGGERHHNRQNSSCPDNAQSFEA
jgi:hypothetical protein